MSLSGLWGFVAMAHDNPSELNKDQVPKAIARELSADQEKARMDYIIHSRKIRCSLVDGEMTTSYWEGSVFSRVEGEKDKLIFKIMGINNNRCVASKNDKDELGFSSVSREIMLYLDPVTGTVLRTWKNPWTNEEVEVLHVANDPVNDKGDYGYTKTGEINKIKFKQIPSDKNLMMSYEIPLYYPNPLAGDYQSYVGNHYHAIELFNYFVSKADLTSTANSIYPNFAWARVSQWLPWMNMGSRPGLLIFNTQGLKIKNFDEVPEPLKSTILKEYPIYATAPPVTDSRPNETSWTVFKKYKEKKQKK